MVEEPTWRDWYWHLLLYFADANLKAVARHPEACSAATKFLSAALALATDERTWQALAWEMQARAALHESNTLYAQESVFRALELVELGAIVKTSVLGCLQPASE